MIDKLGLGAAQFGMNYGVTNRVGRPSLDEVAAILDTAYAAGIRTIDTAPAYDDSEAVLGNAAGAIMGMLQYAGRALAQPQTRIVGTTLMGATNDGVVRAVRYLEERGHHVISFHSTGTGGRVMEELIAAGTITAAMDLTLHEIVYEYFGSGFGYGALGRLTQGVAKAIPMVICPGGIDFICQWQGALFADVATRKMMWHNGSLAHVKLTVPEVTDIGRLIVGRLNAALPGKVVVVMPTQGFRTFAKPGQAMHDPAVDQAIIEVFRRELRADIPVEWVDASLDDDEFSRAAAEAMDALLGGAA